MSLVHCSQVDTFYTSGLSEIVAVIRKPNSILVVMLQGFMFFNFPQNLSKIFQRFEYSTEQYSTVQYSACLAPVCVMWGAAVYNLSTYELGTATLLIIP